MRFCSNDFLLIVQVPSQRGRAALAHSVALRLPSLKSVLRDISVPRDPSHTKPPNKCECLS